MTIRTAAACLLAALGFALEGGVGTVTLVDGRSTPSEILFQHPAAPLLILRSTSHRTLQSLPLAMVHAVAIGGKATTVSPKRALSAVEAQTLQRDGLWVDEVGKGQIRRYATQAWEPRPAMVWARPGTSASGLLAASWLDERGRPLSRLPWESTDAAKPAPFDGDILAPQAETAYEILQPGMRDHLPYYRLRHLTVERNASYKLHYQILGNLWVKDGAVMGDYTQVGRFGSPGDVRHAVMRFCNWHDLPYEPKWPYADVISHWVKMDLAPEGSMEVVGLTGGPSDRYTLGSGTLVVSEGSYLGCGDRAAFYNAPGSTIILLDGANIACPSPLKGGSSKKTIGTLGFGGRVLIGTPERPITRDVELGVAYYPLDELDTTGNASSRSSGGSLILGAEGSITVHSADPQRARLVIRPRSREAMPLTMGKNSGLKGLRRNSKRAPHANDKFLPGPPELFADPEVPTGIIAILRGRTDFNGVLLDGFHPGGIVVDPEARKSWRNIAYGPANQAQGDALFRAP